MGSVAAAVQEDSTSPSELEAAFLERCAASGDAAYGELRELLARLHDPATRQEARVFLTCLRRRSCSGEGEEGFFRRYGFCVRELLLHDSRCGLPITTLSSGTLTVPTKKEANNDGDTQHFYSRRLVIHFL
ncbi:unnamed protein product [Triticum turgidum subsp. durum]|uniref:Uncharacterized protein n=1 Tax=Triticum turgidum subsp. durum TaxID=4567 RepID=A0A9R0QLG0_TRITD|nr:unnamed protein product [Triticum turgidum subsp. durum]